ncbi:alcohol dehydrogenase catalytic domain-containing protein [Paracoccus albus]|uniref:alcohol dehydrogenase catalytic domain-containing protein n=1 Tax=Paracoccus albus TaxID=3017784 RepID=UPI0022F0DBC3|nr:alcohol dehydrogenase catalytic domain-containing protein [Paracoccus albus]WBU61601.1 alcohol dehydrogenase catalytic domain-containing protein [Paracoccus albus]
MSRNDHPAAALNRLWPYRGETFDELLNAQARNDDVPSPAKEELVAKVEAVSICSSDVKVVRMGRDHPLFAEGRDELDTVLGHEVCLRVHAVGEGHAGRFRPGQRLALQPALIVNGKRSIIGMDRPGGFAQYLRLGSEALNDQVMAVPDDVAAASVALLEPYGCVERAWRPNVRLDFKPAGRALIVSAGAQKYELRRVPDWAEVTVIGAVPSFLASRDVTRADSVAELTGPFDDILALGDLDAETLAALSARLDVGGLLLQARSGASPGPVAIDPARIHYDRLSFLGTRDSVLDNALDTSAARFDVRPGGVALIHGAGGAMGRIHVHRLLQLPDGPRIVIASSRKGKRLSDLQSDFAPLALSNGRRLIVAEPDELDDLVQELAPDGLDDIAVVAPDPLAIAAASGWLAPDGLLVLFAGFPYGKLLEIDLAAVALSGMRITGSTGCTLGDMKDVFSRVCGGTLDLSANIAAVAGLNSLPEAMKVVADGTVSGKIIIYPQQPDLPLRDVTDWSASDEDGLTG